MILDKGEGVSGIGNKGEGVDGISDNDEGVGGIGNKGGCNGNEPKVCNFCIRTYSYSYSK